MVKFHLIFLFLYLRVWKLHATKTALKKGRKEFIANIFHMFLTFALGLAWMQLEFFRAAHMVLCVLCVVPAELVTHFALAEAKHCPPSPAPHTVPYPGKCAGVARGFGGQDSQSNGPKTYPIPHKVTFCGKLEQGEFSQGSSAQRMAGHQSAEWQVVSD